MQLRLEFTAHSDIERQDDKWIPVSERLDELVAACIEFGRQADPDWLTRIESAQRELREYIAELKGVIEILEDQQREAKNILIDKNLHIDSLYEEGYKLQQRIAELEAFIKRLIEAGNELEAGLDEYWEELSTREVANWRRLVKKWEEREE